MLQLYHERLRICFLAPTNSFVAGTLLYVVILRDLLEHLFWT